MLDKRKVLSQRKQKLSPQLNVAAVAKEAVRRTAKEMTRQLPDKKAKRNQKRDPFTGLDSKGQALLRRFLFKPNISIKQAAYECGVTYAVAQRRCAMPDFQEALRYQNETLTKSALTILQEKRPALMMRAVELAICDTDTRVAAHMLRMLLQAVVNGDVDEAGDRQPDTLVLRFASRGKAGNNSIEEAKDGTGASYADHGSDHADHGSDHADNGSDHADHGSE